MTTRHRIIFAAIVSLFLAGCGKEGESKPAPQPEQGTTPSELADLWKTSPADGSSTERLSLFSVLQTDADNCPASIFTGFLQADDNLASSLIRSYKALACYNAAFDRVLEGLKAEKPASDEVYIYLLYNMGYVIMTPSVSFGIDIYHRRAAELEPYLDFCCFTHVHQDHKSEPLIEAMRVKGKPVLQNFLSSDNPYTSTVGKDYAIGEVNIHTFITRHNNDTQKNVPVTVFQITCKTGSGSFTLMHSGDSNFRPEEYDVTEAVNVYIPRYAPNALTENNVIGKVFSPDHVLLSHILELSHTAEASRWSLAEGLERASKINCENTYMPFWGEKMTWKGNTLK